jgi:EmrB/QacA subfamily drug resistance transporter
VDAYTIVLASLLLFSGSMSDRFGRRRVFQIGFTIFALGSLLCSLTHSIHGLSAFRALQGLGASMLNPVALSIIANVFPDPKERAKAIGIWGAVMGVSLAVGRVLGGILTQTVGWRAIFWINVPICVAAIALTARFVPESKAQRARSFDPVGQALAFAALFSLTYAIIEGPHDGWGSPWILGLFATAALCIVLFFLYEPNRRDPLIDPRFFRSAPFSSAVLLALLAFSSYSGFLFLNALYLQQARGFSAFHTGLCTLPFAAAIMITAPISGRMIGHYGPRPSMAVAGLGFLLSTLILTRLSLVTPLPQLMLAYTLFGIGLGMINAAITNNAVSGMPLTQAGVAGAVASTGRQVGTALGVAVAGAVFSVNRARGLDFIHSTHSVWWGMTASAVMIMLIGWLATTEWATRSATNVAARFKNVGAA